MLPYIGAVLLLVVVIVVGLTAPSDDPRRWL